MKEDQELKGNHQYNSLEQLFGALNELSEQLFTFKKSCAGSRLVEDALQKAKGRLDHADRSLKLYYYTVENAPDAIYWVDSEARFIYVNDVACKYLGYGRDELLSMGVTDIDSGFNSRMWHEHWKELRKRGRFTVERVHKTKDGRLIPVEISVNYIEVEGNEYNCAFVRDISGRKRAEEELRQGEEKIRSIFRAAPTGIGFAVNRSIKEVNSKLCQMLGYSRDELLDRGVRILYPTNEEFEYVGREQHRQIAESGTGTLETKWVRKDGRIIDIFLSLTPIDPQDMSQGITFTALDVTEHKQAEDALKEAKARAELYVDVMSHDVGNINQSILGYLELALTMCSLREDQKEFIEKPIELVKYISDLIGNVRKLQRVMSGEIKPEAIDLGEVIAMAISRRLCVPGRDISVVYTPVTGYYVLASELLKDAFLNLINNAIVHSRGSLVVNISVSTTMINGKKNYSVAVEDNGPGIPDELKRNILISMRDVKDHTVRRGLGLQFVKALTDIYHGKVRVEDRVPGDRAQGSRFVITLPAA